VAGEENRKRLGEILIEQGMLKEEELVQALEIQKQEGGLIGEILLRNRMVTEEDLVISLATLFDQYRGGPRGARRLGAETSFCSN